MQFKHFIALNVLDVITTYTALSYFEGLGELNGLYAGMFDNYGIVAGLVVIKLIGMVFMYAMLKIMPVMSNLKLLKWNYKYNPKTLSTNVICYIFLFVVMNNLYWIAKNINIF